jgi:hypothetical protein
LRSCLAEARRKTHERRGKSDSDSGCRRSSCIQSGIAGLIADQPGMIRSRRKRFGHRRTRTHRPQTRARATRPRHAHHRSLRPEKVPHLRPTTNAWAQMNDAMIRECKLHGYTGFQFDFENIEWTDRDQLTKLVQISADALHQAGLQLTIATVPNAPGYPGAGGFAKWIYTDWRGAYDIAAIAKSVDLVCFMTYDQHTRWTMPGPLLDGIGPSTISTTPSRSSPRKNPLSAFLFTVITGTQARPPRTRPQAQATAPTSFSIATRCASGSSSPISAPSRTATNSSRKIISRAFAPGS